MNRAAFTTGDTYTSLITFTMSEISILMIKVTVNTKDYNVQILRLWQHSMQQSTRYLAVSSLRGLTEFHAL